MTRGRNTIASAHEVEALKADGPHVRMDVTKIGQPLLLFEGIGPGSIKLDVWWS